MRLLFITWDAPEASYLESLFLPIFAGLRAAGVATDVLQFRWGERDGADRAAAACAQAGSRYRAVNIVRQLGGAGPLLSAAAGRWAVRRAVRDWGIDVIMPRSLMPAIAVLAAGGAKLRPIAFDADGFAADERVDFAGQSPHGLTYRLLRDVEAELARQAQAVLVRSAAARNIMTARIGAPSRADRIHFVTNGRDAARFTVGDTAARAAARADLGVAEDAPLLVFAGSVGPQYRFDLLAANAAAILRERTDMRLLVLSGEPERARSELSRVDESLAGTAIIRRVAPLEVPAYLAAADLGFSHRAPAFATAGVAPLKLAEYMLCGLPVVGTIGVGNTRPAEEAGLFFDDRHGSEETACWFITHVLADRDGVRQRARAIAEQHFSLERSVADYAAALHALR
jgi:glycosyltransferase involved in cell wall biosynthesis